VRAPTDGRSSRALDEGDGRRSVLAYFDAFGPAPSWDELVRWPPDVFALTNLVLDHTEGYRFAVAPPPERRWPPGRDWNDRVRVAARAWSATSGGGGRGELPSLVRRSWDTLTRDRLTSIGKVRSGEAWEICEALLTLHSAADEACAAVATKGRGASPLSFEGGAWRLLQAQGSLSRLSPTRVRVVPKTHFSTRGITIRSLSRYLALCYESVEVRWRSVQPGASNGRRDIVLALFPWPLAVEAADFRSAAPAPLENMDRERFGFFEFAPERPLDTGLVDELLGRAGRVDAVVFPEGAVRPEEIADLERVLERHEASFLVAGARQSPTVSAFGRNYLHFGVRGAAGWERHEQDKHHRWCLDEDQIRRYHLTRSLDPRKLWWEAIDIRERTLEVVDVGGGVTVTPLVCEDLARLDEVADLVRRIGPSLVLAVLLDGPQLASRWSCRYASILADEPGSAVLTLTSYGMAALSRPPGMPRSRVVALWSSRPGGTREIELAPRACAVLLTAAIEGKTLWTADGRRHDDVPGLVLTSVRQLSAPAARRAGDASGRGAARV
jgi:hypothetical protein